VINERKETENTHTHTEREREIKGRTILYGNINIKRMKNKNKIFSP
jgi:hypothetical protein